MTGDRPEHRPRPATIFHESAGAVVLVDGRCLVLRRTATDEWIIPKGHLEQGERPEDAAVREVREETGFEIRILGPMGSTRYGFGHSQENRKRVYWFLAEQIGGSLTLEPIFSEAILLDGAGARMTLSHAGDREIAEQAFAFAEKLDR